MQIIVFYIVTSDEASAHYVADEVMKQHLAGCANIFPINSIFPWEGAIQHAQELVILFKTTSSKREELSALISQIHPYEIPCIISWEVNVNDAYGKWINDNVRSEK